MLFRLTAGDGDEIAFRIRQRPPGASPSRGVRARRLVLALALLGSSLVASTPGRADNPPVPAESVSTDIPSPSLSSDVPAEPRPAPPPAARPVVRPESRPSAAPTTPPADFRDVQAWLDFKRRQHLDVLPDEAQLYLRRGLQAKQAGDREEAFRLVRAAADLDPAFVTPHLTLASWFLTSDLSQALLQYAAVLELARHDFNLQLEVATNAALIGLEALFLGLLAAGLLLVWHRNAELRHPWQERLARDLPAGAASILAWVLVALPFALGVGVALPVVGFLGLLWTDLKLRERSLFVMLVLALAAAPLLSGVLERATLPLQEDRAPFYGITMIENQPWSAAAQQRFQELAARHPDDAFLQFGLAWTARRGRDLATAEAAYRRALKLLPSDDRILNNLGNTLSIQGQADAALEMYRRAVAVNPSNAAAWFNNSQICTQRFDYHAATEALSRASALDFELVKTYQSRGTADGLLPLADQWIAPATFWRALRDAPPGPGALPLAWRARIEFSGWRFSIAVAVTALLALLIGRRLHHTGPLKTCSNCGSVVCRRCAQRRREQALCPACATLESRAESREFARVLLLQKQRRARRSADLVRTSLAAIVPGYGLLALRRVFGPVLLLGGTALLLRGWVAPTPPFAVEPRLASPGQEIPVAVQAGFLILIYAISLLGYFGAAARARAQAESLAAPTRARAAQSTGRVTSLAA